MSHVLDTFERCAPAVGKHYQTPFPVRRLEMVCALMMRDHADNTLEEACRRRERKLAGLEARSCRRKCQRYRCGFERHRWRG